MLFIKYDETGLINTINHRPNNLTKETLNEGIIIDQFPNAENYDGKDVLKYVNLSKVSNGETYKGIDVIYYKYEDKINAKNINQLKLNNADLLMKQAMQDIELENSKRNIAELMIKVAMLEIGGDI